MKCAATSEDLIESFPMIIAHPGAEIPREKFELFAPHLDLITAAYDQPFERCSLLGRTFFSTSRMQNVKVTSAVGIYKAIDVLADQPQRDGEQNGFIVIDASQCEHQEAPLAALWQRYASSGFTAIYDSSPLLAFNDIVLGKSYTHVVLQNVVYHSFYQNHPLTISGAFAVRAGIPFLASSVHDLVPPMPRDYVYRKLLENHKSTSGKSLAGPMLNGGICKDGTLRCSIAVLYAMLHGF